jgi:tetratricopeptide (TPR) repeat protein
MEGSPTARAPTELTLLKPCWLPWVLLAALAAVWGTKAWNYVGEWRDPRSVWYGAHLKTPNSQVRQFLGEVYQNAGDRVSNFIKSGTPLQVTNELRFARAVLGNGPQLDQLRAEWTGATPTRTSSIAYRDQLWDLAWQQYEDSVARRGTLSAPNLFMCRGRLLVSRGKFAQAIPEFQNALAFAQTSSYSVTRAEGATHALFAIGVAYWNMGDYAEAQQWLLKAQAIQRKSGQLWLPALDQEVERIKRITHDAGRP